MSEQFFVGRAKELERLEHFTLRPGSTAYRPRLAHIWGPEGYGKSALVQKFTSILSEETVPIISFSPDILQAEIADDTEYFQLIFRSTQTNMETCTHG